MSKKSQNPEKWPKNTVFARTARFACWRGNESLSGACGAFKHQEEHLLRREWRKKGLL
jgi:hypothetical protein